MTTATDLSKLTNAERAQKVIHAVKAHYAETNLGMAQGFLIHALGFSAKDVERALACNPPEIISYKGKGGGCFPADVVREKADVNESLREKAFELLATMLESKSETVSNFASAIEDLILERDLETERRSNARKAKQAD